MAGFFSCLGLGGSLADDRHCGPKEQGDQDSIGKGLHGRFISDFGLAKPRTAGQTSDTRLELLY